MLLRTSGPEGFRSLKYLVYPFPACFSLEFHDNDECFGGAAELWRPVCYDIHSH
jgi:hypothetical protein